MNEDLELPEQDDPLERLKKRRAAAAQQAALEAPVGEDPLERLKAQKAERLLQEAGMLPGADKATRRHFEYSSGQLAKTQAEKNAAEVAANEAADKASISPLTKALGTAAALGRDIPGGEFLQTGARSIFRGEPQAEAFGDIRKAENAAPAVARNLARLTGGTIAAMALPKVLGKVSTGTATPGTNIFGVENIFKPITNVAAQGGQYAALNQALQADPSKGIRERGNEAIGHGTVGALAGKASEKLTNLLRTTTAPTIGAVTAARRTARSQAADPLFDASRAEIAAGGGTTPGVSQTYNEPLVKPLAESIKSSNELWNRTHPGMTRPTDEGSILMQAYRELGEDERSYASRIDASAAFRPLTERERADVESIKKLITGGLTSPSSTPATFATVPAQHYPRHPNYQPATTGAQITPAQNFPPLAPSFGPANQTFAQHSGDLKTFQDAANAIDRVVNRTKIDPAKAHIESPEAFMTALKGQTPEQARASTQGILGGAQENMGFRYSPFRLFGVPESIMRANRAVPYLQATDEITGGDPAMNLLRALGIAGAGRE